MDIEKIKNGLRYTYKFLKTPAEHQEWITYYLNNPKFVRQYYSDEQKEEDTISKIEQSALDTANGFIRGLTVSREGNPESTYRGELPDIICGIAFITPETSDPNDKSNILISVGVFTTKQAAFYAMIGIVIGFGAKDKKKGLSSNLSGFIADIMSSQSGYFGKPKISFITRPLAKMAELFKASSQDELNIPYNESLSLPETSSPEYATKKKYVIEQGEIRKSQAVEWLKSCDKCPEGGQSCKIEECVGDLPFFNYLLVIFFNQNGHIADYVPPHYLSVMEENEGKKHIEKRF